jgi:hypothetical protein
MRAHRVRRRIVWLVATAALGLGAVLGASAAAADETGTEAPSTTDGASTESVEWN